MMALTDDQMNQVKQAAALLPVGSRDLFLRSVAGRLSDSAAPTDHEVAAAINLVLSCRGVSTPIFCCDSATTNSLRRNSNAKRKVFSERFGNQR
jgi:hypothetical protein